MIIDSRQKLEQIADLCRSQRQTIVVASGGFDILLPEDISYLWNASIKANVLFVLIDSDEGIREKKSVKDPLLPAAARLEIVDSLWMVDFVFVMTDSDIVDLLKLINPDVYAFLSKPVDIIATREIDPEIDSLMGDRIAFIDAADQSYAQTFAKLYQYNNQAEKLEV